MDRQALIRSGWRRHSIISDLDNAENVAALSLPPKIQRQLEIPESILIISTYDCAVVNPDFEKEPWLQLLVATPTAFNKNYASSRNPRILHFDITYLQNNHAYEVNAAGICQTERQVLSKLAPDSNYSLSEKSRTELSNWLCDRFKLVTWPDGLNNALRPRDKQIKKLWKNYNNFISALYLQLNTYAELNEDKYQVAAIFAVAAGKERSLLKHVREKKKELENKSLEEVRCFIESEIINAFGKSVNFMDDPNSLTKYAVEVLDEKQITMDMLRRFYRFSPYSMSENDSESPTPVDLKANKS